MCLRLPFPAASPRQTRECHQFLKTPLIFPNDTITHLTLPSPKRPISCRSSSSNHNQTSHYPSLQNHQTKLWNAKIKHHLQNGDYQNTLSFYHQMLHENIPPNSTTFSHLLKACSFLFDLKTLRLIHNDILRFHIDAERSIVTALVIAYLKCGRTDIAHQVIGKMPCRDVISWTMIIGRIAQEMHFDSAIWAFRMMLEEGGNPDEIALVSIISTATDYGCLKHGMEAHGYLIRKGFEFNEIVIGSLVKLYTKLGKTVSANRIFDETRKNNVVVWTALIAGLIHRGDAFAAVKMFKKMVNSGVEPSESSMSCILRAISQLGHLHIGIQVHGQIIKRQLTSNLFLTSSLIDMYAKCSNHSFSCQKLFDGMKSKDIVSWTTMISAYGRQGDGQAALRTFNDMLEAGLCPDSITFTSVLSACSSSGMLQEGLTHFDSMITEHKIRPREEHYAVLTDLIAKDGRLEEAYELIESMNLRDDKGVWESFLRACRAHGNVGCGELAAGMLMKVESDSSLSYFILSDIYSAVGRWKDADMFGKMATKMRKVGSVSERMGKKYVHCI